MAGDPTVMLLYFAKINKPPTAAWSVQVGVIRPNQPVPKKTARLRNLGVNSEANSLSSE
jgi:hypothetical protein